MFDPVASCIAEIRRALDRAVQDLELPTIAEYSLEYSAISDHGDLSSNIAFQAARIWKIPAYQGACRIRDLLSVGNEIICDVAVSPNGFLNFRLNDSWLNDSVSQILDGTINEYAVEETRRKALLMVPGTPEKCRNDRLYRTLAVIFSLTEILSQLGYDVETQPNNEPIMDRYDRVYLCYPDFFWDSSLAPDCTVEDAVKVVVRELSEKEVSSEWNEDMTLQFNSSNPASSLDCSKDPAFDMRYRYARLCSLIRSYQRKGSSLPAAVTGTVLSEEDRSFLKLILDYPSRLSSAAHRGDPSVLFRYLTDLDEAFLRTREAKGASLGLAASIDPDILFFAAAEKRRMIECLDAFRFHPPEYL